MKPTWYKHSIRNPITGGDEFDSVDVRRLMGMFADFRDNSEKALNEMKEWLGEGNTDISFDEAKARLSYYLEKLGLR